MNALIASFAISFAVIFVAELGDKSQLMALTFATRYRALPVLLGITVATLVVHAVSVGVGYGLGQALPSTWISLAAAVAFFAFGAWTLRGDALSRKERAKARQTPRSALVAVSVAFFLAELGDKTMLATITLATQHGWLGTWLGSTAGMVVADAVAILVGRQLGRHLPDRAIRYCAGGLFLAFGGWLMVEALKHLTAGSPAADTVWAGAAAVLLTALVGYAATSAALRRRRQDQQRRDEQPDEEIRPEPVGASDPVRSSPTD